MIVNSLMNLGVTIRSLYLAIKHKRWGEWRYPRIGAARGDLVFGANARTADQNLFETLKHSWVRSFLKHFDSPLVILAGYKGDRVVITAYRFIRDDGRTDLCDTVLRKPGHMGVFHYLSIKGQMYHTLHSNTVTRQMGFVEEEPVFSLDLEVSNHHLIRARHLAEEDHSLQSSTWLTLGGNA